jgi:hypothetical protein
LLRLTSGASLVPVLTLTQASAAVCELVPNVKKVTHLFQHLWRVALGIDVRFIRKRCPTDYDENNGGWTIRSVLQSSSGRRRMQGSEWGGQPPPGYRPHTACGAS